VPLEIVWSPLALKRLQEIREFVAKDKPIAAGRLATRIVATVQTLRRYPYMGRPGWHRDVRELVIARTPYIILYKVHRSRITINTIWHGAQMRETK